MSFPKYRVLTAILAGYAQGFARIPELSSTGNLKVSRQSGTVPFDAQNQYVSTTGIHQFIAPSGGDVRGPCPGLNAMANHGYMPRSGVGLISDFITGTSQAYGMALDLGGFLAAYGALFDGTAALWSIAGTEHIGIGGSHNNYETDSSPTRGDLNQYGSNTDLVISQFTELYNMQPDPATANYDLDVIKQFRYKRFNESIAENPFFYFPAFSGAVVSSAAHIFIFRLFGNKSADYPEGYLNQDVLKSFFSIQGSADNLTWVPGYERIPDNWYKLNDEDQYALEDLITDIDELGAGQEAVLQPGCNMGEVNTFVPINTTAMSGGAYGSSNSAADLLCFGLAYSQIAIGILPGLGGAVADVLGEYILPVQNSLGCETVPSLNMSVAQACPGYSLYGGPTGPVAPGAIQQ